MSNITYRRFQNSVKACYLLKNGPRNHHRNKCNRSCNRNRAVFVVVAVGFDVLNQHLETKNTKIRVLDRLSSIASWVFSIIMMSVI